MNRTRVRIRCNRSPAVGVGICAGQVRALSGGPRACPATPFPTQEPYVRNNRSAAALAAFLLASGAAVTLATAHPALAGTPGGTYAYDRNSDFDGDGFEDVVIAAPDATVAGASGAGRVSVRYGTADGVGVQRVSQLSQATPRVPGAPEAGDRFGAALATGDLDSDGYDDLVVGVPGEDLGGARDAGGATVLWGGAGGLASPNGWLQARRPTDGERFGAVLAAARFSAANPGDLLVVADRDGLELLEFAPGELPGPGPGPGQPGGDQPGGIVPRAAEARAGQAAGAGSTVTPRTLTRQALSRPAGARAVLPRTLTTGDHNRDGLADLVVSGVTTGAEPGHGWSAYFPGGDRGPGYARESRGGPVAASGDIDGDGYDDLVTGEPASPDDGGETLTGGLVGVRYGGPDGPAATPQWWTQDSPGLPGAAERGDAFGGDLSVADADGDGYADVVIGAPGEDVGRAADAGAVWVLRGMASGLSARGVAHWNQDSRGVPGRAERGDAWGAQVRFTGPDPRGLYALLASAPGEDGGRGAVWVLPAGPGGVSPAGAWTFGLDADGGAAAGKFDAARFGSVIDE
ncbi:MULTISPECIES: FG-GAP and VCBS repeat-containing protein [unclassified Streptomyces]|uniref:FG-GAP and VCBS repeat-containing protein n=1 Tax=unclassified Streptomyces TaxID=2593676 RepID=UPI000823F424|nr:FG-GAP and VCBS repeat-containing protein [Streptomyces sp. SID4919]SCK20011.1 FG-GAP repeat-containing protein [Streptomyces sp. AmelKG-E11A]